MTGSNADSDMAEAGNGVADNTAGTDGQAGRQPPPPQQNQPAAVPTVVTLTTDQFQELIAKSNKPIVPINEFKEGADASAWADEFKLYNQLHKNYSLLPGALMLSAFRNNEEAMRWLRQVTNLDQLTADELITGFEERFAQKNTFQQSGGKRPRHDPAPRAQPRGQGHVSQHRGHGHATQPARQMGQPQARKPNPLTKGLRLPTDKTTHLGPNGQLLSFAELKYFRANGLCHNCGQQGHLREHCPKPTVEAAE